MSSLRSIIIASLICAGAALNYEEAKEIILENVKSYQPTIGKSLCQANTCCNITSTESCAISSFEKGETTMVLPGGKTRCIYSYSTPFAFQVIPGDSDKVLFYLQGGGACWDEVSTKIGFCSSDSAPQSQVGIFDRTNANNHFKSHTVVHVSYCSGDVFGGDVVRPYNDKDGVPVEQRGLANVQSALDWVVSQQQKSLLSPVLSELVVMGCSAGSVGAQLWSNQVVSSLKWSTAAVVPDSYAGVFPDGSMGPLIYSYGFCNSGFLSDDLQKKCDAQTLTLQDIDLEFFARTPSVPVNFIQSKVDIVQQSFYIAIGVTTNNTQKTINPTEFYTDVNGIFGGMYNPNLKNFVTYLVDGDHHCFTNQDLYYTADAKGPNDNGETNSEVKMYEWVNPLPLANGGQISSVCEGSLQGAVGRDDNTYCSSTVIPKTFTEAYF